MNQIFHDSCNEKYKYPFGAIKQDSEVCIRIDVDKKYRSCSIRLWSPNNNETIVPMNFVERFGDKFYEAKFKLNEIGLNWYCFIIQDNDYDLKYYGCNAGYSAGDGNIVYEFPHYNSFQITCFDKNFSTPNWFKGNIMYQIFPDRFHRNKEHKFDTKKYEFIHKDFNEEIGCTEYGANNFEYYGGNIKGIQDKLPYLKELNIKTIYLNPVFKSKSNHRYDTCNFLELDEMLGYEEDFREFCKVAKEMDMGVIIDVSWNHVGDDSIYFNKYKNYGEDGAFYNKNSNYRSWFFINEDDTYDAWWGHSSLPVLNKSNSEYRKHVKKAIAYWCSLGIAGFRLDVIDDIPDDFLEWFRKEVKSVSNDLVIFGEVWEDATLKKGFNTYRSYLYGLSQDTIMNYVLRNIILEFIAYGPKEKEVAHESISGDTFKKKYLNLLSNYPNEAMECAMNLLSSHDISRILTLLSDLPYSEDLTKKEQCSYVIPKDKYELGKKRIKLAWSMIMCLKGNPSLFYGDETGVYGYNDPANRKPMNWDSMDIELLDWFKSISTIRDEYTELKYGHIKFLHCDDDIVSFERMHDNNSVVYMCNRSENNRKIKIDDKEYDLEPLEYRILKK